MHNAALGSLGLPYVYVPFSVEPENLGRALQSLSALGIVGVNLTIPHKERALEFVDEVTDEAREVGAINTVHCLNGRLIADNTDGAGFCRPLVETGFVVRECRAVVLGAGGAARSVLFKLAREGARNIWLVNRSRERADRLAASLYQSGYEGCDVQVLSSDDSEGVTAALGRADLLVHCTRIGMFPDVDAAPVVPLAALHRNLFVYDLIYNPIETSLVTEARRQGCRVLGGAKMLVYQGAASFQRWTGIWPPTELMESVVNNSLASK